MAGVSAGADVPVVYAASGESTSPRWCAAFAEGCGGEIVVDAGRLLAGPMALFGSPRLWHLVEQARSEGRRFYYGDHAYFGRGAYYRITRDAFQHDGSGEAGPERFINTEAVLQPWRSGGGHVLVCPQSDVFHGLHGQPDWLARTLEVLARHTDRELRVRRKPRAGSGTPPIAEDLAACWAVVTFTSNSAVDAVMAGVPAFCTGPCAASAMALEDLALIESPVRPEGRAQWAWNLAANQWTLDEIASGEAWRALNCSTTAG